MMWTPERKVFVCILGCTWLLYLLVPIMIFFLGAGIIVVAMEKSREIRNVPLKDNELGGRVPGLLDLIIIQFARSSSLHHDCVRFGRVAKIFHRKIIALSEPFYILLK